jgi:glycosyltransferase involved in cell wall biosynthesis
MLVSVVIPAYNESATLPDFLAEVEQALASTGWSWEALVLDDASVDDTPAVLARLSSTMPQLRVIRNPHNLGCHPSTLIGFAQARGQLCVFVPGDGQIPASEIIVMVQAAQAQQVEVLYTWRVPRADPWHRRLIGWMYNQVLFACWRIGVHDADSASLLSRRAVQHIVPHLNAHSALLTTEILLVAQSQGLPLGECRIRHRPRTAGQAKGMNWRDLTRLPGDMMKLIQWKPTP